jgi:cell shape-determining protein MreC
MRRYIIVFIMIVLFGVIFFTDFFVKKERAHDEILLLKQENEDLRAQIQKCAVPDIQSLKQKQEILSGKYLRVRVFSVYPFNIRNQLTINAGEEQGIKNMMPAVLAENILVGRIKEVSRKISVIQTVFDPAFETPVRIGGEGVNGLLQGGSEPKIVLIEKTKPLARGDLVYSAGPDFPYGLKIGEIDEIRESIPGVFKEAIIKAPFKVGDIREVNILLE